jgi:hypothetical protein
MPRQHARTPAATPTTVVGVFDGCTQARSAQEREHTIARSC